LTLLGNVTAVRVDTVLLTSLTFVYFRRILQIGYFSQVQENHTASSIRS